MPKQVFVLGAGFTRAFYPKVPLMLDDYGARELSRRCREALPYAKVLVDEESRRDPEKAGRINIESLMTRLHSGMPYDRALGYTDQFRLLLTWLKEAFIERIKDAQKEENHRADLERLAEHCLRHDVTCITFNYDDLFDQALVRAKTQRASDGMVRFWKPSFGYGFLLSQEQWDPGAGNEFDSSRVMRLLKLHGSMNWRPKLGSSRPLSVDALMHFPKWPEEGQWGVAPGIEDNLEKEPFIIPPVLLKVALTKEPILRLLWTRAYQALWDAEEVTFVGYSLPMTDIAAVSLFAETLNRVRKPNIRVISFGAQDEGDALRKTYVKVLPDVPPKHFEFGGALESYFPHLTLTISNQGFGLFREERPAPCAVAAS